MSITTEADVRRAALNLLARREHSEWELKHKLLNKNFPSDIVDETLQKLLAENLLSNVRFIENYTHARRAKGYGPVRIRLELLQRGISENLASEHLDCDDISWTTSVRSVWKKKFKGVLPKTTKDRLLQMQFLHYRGFTTDHINTIFESEN